MNPIDLPPTAYVQTEQPAQVPPAAGKPPAEKVAAGKSGPGAPPTTYVPTNTKSSPGPVHMELGPKDGSQAKSATFMRVLTESGWSGDTLARDVARLIDNPQSRTLPNDLAEAGISKDDLQHLKPEAHAAMLENLWTGLVGEEESRAGVIFMKTLARQGKLGPMIDELMATPDKFQNMLQDMDTKNWGVAQVADILKSCSPPPKSLQRALQVIQNTPPRV